MQVRKNENLGPLYSELLGSDNPVFHRLVDKFIASIPGYLEEIEQAMLKADGIELKGLFHNIKGVSGNYGYPELYEECKKAEKLAIQNSVELDAIVESIIGISRRIMLASKLE